MARQLYLFLQRTYCASFSVKNNMGSTPPAAAWTASQPSPLLLEHRAVYQRPIIVFLYTRTGLGLVARSPLWICMLRNGMPAKCLSIVKATYRQILVRVRMYGQLSSFFAVPGCVRQGCFVFSFLFSFALDNLFPRAFAGVDFIARSLFPWGLECTTRFSWCYFTDAKPGRFGKKFCAHGSCATIDI